MIRLIGLFCGVIFGLGLAASGMTNTAKVIGFLDVFGNWDPDLLFVMGFAVLTTIISFFFILKRKESVFGGGFRLPKSKDVDKHIVSGAILFGIGWGVFGYCPGPAIASLVYLQPATLVFVATMLIGMWLGNRLSA
jgi:uncharacterized membrane protein YedE/YeeE